MSTSSIDHVRRCLGTKYVIERELGRGGMGAVYLARDLRLDRPVALKVLPPEYATDAALRERFLRETRTSASFSHPNIVPVYAVEDTDGLLAYVMGFVEGESLTERVRRTGPLGVRELVRLLQDVGYALAYAHGRGVVHRDLKPDNVMIERATGRALLMDFGIARPIAAASAPTRPGLTRIGEVVGTPEYMSPEQATADTLDGRSDIYSLGLVAYFAATGRTAMEGDTPRSVMMRQLSEMPAPLAEMRPDLPAPLTAAIDRCVMKDPAERFQTAEDLVEAIDEAQLAGPEVSIAIRALIQELSTLLMVLAFVLVISYLVVNAMPTFLPLFVRLMPSTFFIAIGVARAWQALSLVRRLAETGYSLDDLMRGLRAVVDEQATVRQELKLDARERARRRRAVRTAAIGLPLGMLTIYLAVTVVAARPADPGPPSSGAVAATPDSTVRLPRRGPPPNEKPAVAMIVMGLAMIGIGAVSLSRSPFRMPPGEFAFRQLFLRAPGRAFLALGVRAADPQATARQGRTITPVRAITPQQPSLPVVAAAPLAPTELARLEARVVALERWREHSGG
jgi:serine/threonine-protein kinase